MSLSLFYCGIAVASPVFTYQLVVSSNRLHSPSSLTLSHAVSSSDVVPSLSMLFAGAQPSLHQFTCQIATPMILIQLKQSISLVPTSYADAHLFPLSIGFSY